MNGGSGSVNDDSLAMRNTCCRTWLLPRLSYHKCCRIWLNASLCRKNRLFLTVSLPIAILYWAICVLVWRFLRILQSRSQTLPPWCFCRSCSVHFWSFPIELSGNQMSITWSRHVSFGQLRHCRSSIGVLKRHQIAYKGIFGPNTLWIPQRKAGSNQI